MRWKIHAAIYVVLAIVNFGLAATSSTVMGYALCGTVGVVFLGLAAVFVFGK